MLRVVAIARWAFGISTAVRKLWHRLLRERLRGRHHQNQRGCWHGTGMIFARVLTRLEMIDVANV